MSITTSFSKGIHLSFGLVLSLYTIQPWSIHFGSIPLQVALVWLIFIWLVLFKFQWVKKVPAAFGSIVCVLIIILIISVLIRTILDGDDSKRFMQLLTGIALSIISALLINDGKNRKYFIYPLLICASASAFVAVMQYLGFFKFTWSHTVYYLSSMKVPSGLESFPVAFSYSVIGVVVLSLSLSLHDFRNKKLKVKIVKPFIGFLCSAVIVAGIYVSESRSGALGIFIGLLASVLLLNRNKRKYINLPTVIGIFIIIIFLGYVSNISVFSNKQDTVTETIKDTRIQGTWSIFMPLIIENPMGVSSRDRENSGLGGLNNTADISIINTLKQNHGYDPHNLIITTMLFYGIPAGISLFLLYMMAIYKGVKAATAIFSQSKCSDVAGVLVLILVASNLSLVVHAWFHNANLVMGEMRGWFWIGSVLGLAYFEKNKA